MIYAFLIAVIIFIAIMLHKKPEANLNQKLWNQVFNSPDQFTKVEWKK